MSQHPLHIRPASIFLDGEEWVPKSYADGLVEALREKQRTRQSHNHQFAEIADCFENLPMSHAGAPYAASAEAFRKHGLCVTGHCDVETISFEDQESAKAAAPAIARLARRDNGYALVVARGPLVVCYTPHSQSFKAMGKERFHQSKRDVLDWAHSLLGVA